LQLQRKIRLFSWFDEFGNSRVSMRKVGQRKQNFNEAKKRAVYEYLPWHQVFAVYRFSEEAAYGCLSDFG